MRRKNGFTLIELLAVIIILGVIMLIAIPSVTQQITNSRKNSYLDTAQQYINAVVTKVNEGNISMFDTKRLYLVPVGNDTTVSCVSLESGGASPYSLRCRMRSCACLPIVVLSYPVRRGGRH